MKSMKKKEEETAVKITTVVFDKLPEHDAIWAFIEGYDGKLYTGICGEITGGMSSYVAGFEPVGGKTEYLVEMASTLGIPADNGQAAHSNVHNSLLQDHDGTLYAATHCTGAPLNDFLWRPWNCWNHPRKSFSGSGLAAFRPDGEILYSKIILNKEGARCMALATGRRKIYGISYPKNHFFVYDLNTRRTEDIGRIGNVNPQCVFLDKAENGYTTDDFGKLLRFDADRNTLSETGVQIPRTLFRNGYHNTVYDVTPAPGGDSVYGVTWTFGERFFRYDFADNHLEDYGKGFGEEEREWNHIIHSHAGGLVCDAGGDVYFTVNTRSEKGSHPWLVRFTPEDRKRTLLAPIATDGKPGDHVSRGIIGSDGCLYFAETGNTPPKLFRFDLGFKLIHNKTRRMWG